MLFLQKVEKALVETVVFFCGKQRNIPSAKSGESLIARQKIEEGPFYSRRWRNVLSMAEEENNPILQQRLPDFGFNICAQTSSDKMRP